MASRLYHLVWHLKYLFSIFTTQFIIPYRSHHYPFFQVFSKSSSDLELVALYPLTVQEGGVSVISRQNIDVILDHHKYGVRPSGVILHVAESPQHGRIAIDLSLQRTLPQHKNYIDSDGKSKQYFTLMDLSRDKVGG